MSSSGIKPIDYGTREFDLSVSRENERIDIRAENIAILRADDTATVRINDPEASGIPVRELSSISIPAKDGKPGINRLYLSNPAGTGTLRLLIGFGGTAGSTDAPSGDQVDVTNRSARELGKARLETKDGVLVDSNNPLPVDGNSSLSEPLDVSDATVTVTDDGAFNIGGTVTTDLTARGPLTATDSGTGSASAAQLDLGTEGGRVPVDVAYDTSGSADLTVEVSSDGSNWHEIDGTPSPTAAENFVFQTDTAFRYVRAYLNQNRNEVEISAKGV